MVEDLVSEGISEDVVSTTPPFTSEMITQLINDVFDRNLSYKHYDFQESNTWNIHCIEEITSALVKLDRPYKYIVSSSLLQTGNSSGLHVSTVSFWNKETDVSFSHRWEGKFMLAIINVYAIAL